jgi:hypothetical protein
VLKKAAIERENRRRTTTETIKAKFDTNIQIPMVVAATEPLKTRDVEF